MHPRLLRIGWMVVCGTTWIVSPWATAADAPPAAARGQAGEILDATGVTGGLVVLVGYGDGRLAAGLHAGEGFLGQALDTDPASVEAARRNIQSLGLYGAVTVDRFDGRHVADAERVYVTLGYHAGVSILDAATGTVVRACAGTDRLMALDAATGQLLWHELRGNSNRGPAISPTPAR